MPLVETTDFMHARYYSPNLGRFLSVDPVGGSVGSSQSWNRYSYVRNNPIRSTDPTGKQTVPEYWSVPSLPTSPGLDDLVDVVNQVSTNLGIGQSDSQELFETFQELYDASERQGDGKQIGRYEMGQEEAKKNYDNMAPDAEKVDEGEGWEVWVGTDKESERTLIYRTRSTDEGGSVATIEEQRKTESDKTRSREIRIDEPIIPSAD
jgi:uncharacterized protein RhaS with RHS repeats